MIALKDNWFIIDNELTSSRSNWVVRISPENDGYKVRFGKGEIGDGGPFLESFIVKTLEEAFSIYEKYREIKMFKDLKETIKNDRKNGGEQWLLI